MNQQRGEIAVELDGANYALRPSFAAYAAIEAELGEGLVGLARRLIEGRYGVRDVAAILCAGLEAADSGIARETVCAMIARGNLIAFGEVAAAFLMPLFDPARTKMNPRPSPAEGP
jgi:hypothetical protein